MSLRPGQDGAGHGANWAGHRLDAPGSTAVCTAVSAAVGDTPRHGRGGECAGNRARRHQTTGGDTPRRREPRASDQGVLSPLRYRCGDPPSSPVARRCRAVRPGAERDHAPATTAKFTAKGMTFSDSGRLHPTSRGAIFRASTTYATRGGRVQHAFTSVRSCGSNQLHLRSPPETRAPVLLPLLGRLSGE